MKISNPKQKVLQLAGFAAIIVVFWILRIPCVWQALLGIPCAGCGMTRATFCALKLDFAEAFGYHRMFWSTPILLGYFLYDGKLFPNRLLNYGILILIGVGFLVNWVLNLV